VRQRWPSGTGNGPAQLVTLEVDADDADASGFEPVWADGKRVGFVTSGGYGHTLGKSLAMAMVDGQGHTHCVQRAGRSRMVRPATSR
jgi:glycine cleavage system aminomethyltransferase T